MKQKQKRQLLLIINIEYLNYLRNYLVKQKKTHLTKNKMPVSRTPPKRIFVKECLEKCLEKIKDNRWNEINVLHDILAIFRDELNTWLLPYLCVLGVYTVWLLILMICNTFLLWSIYNGNKTIITPVSSVAEQLLISN